MSKQAGLAITKIDDLVKASNGTLVTLPGFNAEGDFVARLKRPSLLALVRAGKIPNALISTANKLFAKGTFDTDDDSAMSNLFEVLDAVCEACFVEPTWQELSEAGVKLTDEQYMFIFNYTQRGVSALGDFR